MDVHADRRTKANSLVRLLAGLLCAVVVPSAQAATWCGGYIQAVFTDGGGRVYVHPTFRAGWIQVCNVNSEWKSVSVAVCKSWFATLVALRLTGENSVFHYNENLSCNGIPAYDGAPSPAYISIDVQ